MHTRLMSEDYVNACVYALTSLYRYSCYGVAFDTYPYSAHTHGGPTVSPKPSLAMCSNAKQKLGKCLSPRISQKAAPKIRRLAAASRRTLSCEGRDPNAEIGIGACNQGPAMGGVSLQIDAKPTNGCTSKVETPVKRGSAVYLAC